MTTPLDARMIAAHRAGDAGLMIALYAEAAETAPPGDAAAFFRTQAYILALEAGDARAAGFHRALRAEGREA